VGHARKPVPGGSERRVRYQVDLAGPVGQLTIGAPVRLKGFDVGEVQEVGLAIKRDGSGIDAPVIIALDPARFAPASGSDDSSLNATLAGLVAKGLRASLQQDPPLVGGYVVSLAAMPEAAPGDLELNLSPPRLPAAASGNLDSIVQEIEAIPVAEIAANVLQVSEAARQVVSSPEIRSSIANLDRTLKELRRTVAQSGPQIAMTAQQLRRTADDLSAAAQSTKSLLGTGDLAQDGTVSELLKSLTRTARSVRELSDYLERHPEALIQGKS
jgi:paraquat-inducible protein B